MVATAQKSKTATTDSPREEYVGGVNLDRPVNGLHQYRGWALNSDILDLGQIDVGKHVPVLGRDINLFAGKGASKVEAAAHIGKEQARQRYGAMQAATHNANTQAVKADTARQRTYGAVLTNAKVRVENSIKENDIAYLVMHGIIRQDAQSVMIDSEFKRLNSLQIANSVMEAKLESDLAPTDGEKVLMPGVGGAVDFSSLDAIFAEYESAEPEKADTAKSKKKAKSN